MATNFQQVVRPLVQPAQAPAQGGQNAQVSANSYGPKSDKPQAQIYLNVGVEIDVTNPDTGETESVFMSLPLGIAIDTMNEADIRGSDNWKLMSAAKNELLRFFKAEGDALQPGEEKFFEGMRLQLKRRGDSVPVPADQNPFIAALSSKLSSAA